MAEVGNAAGCKNNKESIGCNMCSRLEAALNNQVLISLSPLVVHLERYYDHCATKVSLTDSCSSRHE